ncbi:hypothetical protein ABT288_37095 [Streptomyces sp. NPDC001093]|uniref:hypothetical protein n=1 Tax=Streptomyces sp. NPDC001093 TaxID=3154376 RepID=UPI003332E21E
MARSTGDSARARALLTRAQRLEHVAASTSAAAWVALLLAQLSWQAGEREAAAAAAARVGDLFARLGDARGPVVLRRTVPVAPTGQSGC